LAGDASSFSLRFTKELDGFITGLADLSGRFSLVAVGSYGRGEMTPNSDIDLLLLHDTKVSRIETERVTQSILYPLWDSGIKVDHSVRSLRDVADSLRQDHRVILGLLDARYLSGSYELFEKLEDLVKKEFKSNLRSYVAITERSVAERHNNFGSLAFDLEPHLKESAGGTRDFALLRSLVRLGVAEVPLAPHILMEAAQRQVELRVMLCKVNPKAQERLSLTDQMELAIRQGVRDLSEFMYVYAKEAQWASVTLREILAHGVSRPKRATSSTGSRGSEEDGSSFDSPSKGEIDRVEVAVCDLIKMIDSEVRSNQPYLARRLSSLRSRYVVSPDRQWSDRDRNAFVTLLQSGDRLLSLWECLDVSDLWYEILPEWRSLRFLRRPNAFHRYSVDRHLIESARKAALLRDRVHRTDLLLLAALLHDIGKAYEGDHSEVGAEKVLRIAERMGFGDEDRQTLASLVLNHLLLAETVTRRDLTDPSTVEMVAAKIGTLERLELVEILTEADSLATGVVSWSGWKESLMKELAFKVVRYLDHGVHGERQPNLPAQILEELVSKASSGHAVVATSDHLYVAARDKKGLLKMVVGSLAISGISVVSADAFELDGIAIDAFRVETWSGGEPNYQRFKLNLKKALLDESFLNERVQHLRQSHSYLSDRRRLEVLEFRPKVEVVKDVSDTALVVEIWASNRRGLLFELSREISDRGFDIRHAKILTMGYDVVDTFYIVDSSGKKPTELVRLEALVAGLERVVSGS
jgi:[protein-PII] uridylyltransferase